MADEDDHEFGRNEDLSQIHRREKKQLQAKIQNLKHGIPKGDKKKKREVALEIARLEAELDEKQKRELDSLILEKDEEDHSIKNGFSCEVEGVAENLENVTVSGDSKIVNKTTKAEKRREKKRQKEKEREQRIAEQEILNQSGARAVEAESLKKVLTDMSLSIHEVPSDGNCMYKAIEHQLSLQGKEMSVSLLRQEASRYMLSHLDEFLPFLTSKETGDMMTPEEFEEYCRETEETTTWGGQVELRALSHVCQTPIKVVQANGPVIDIGTEYTSPPVLLSYHHHIYEMGEHYNSLVPLEPEDE